MCRIALLHRFLRGYIFTVPFWMVMLTRIQSIGCDEPPGQTVASDIPMVKYEYTAPFG